MKTGGMMRRGRSNFVIGSIFVLIFAFSKFGFAEEQKAAPQETVGFIKKTNDILQSMNDKIKEKTDLVKQKVNSENIQDTYRREAEITAVIAGYKEQIESIAAPAECAEFKTIIVKLMSLMGQMHSALSKGDIDQYKLLVPQVTEYSSKMQKEIKSLQAYYKN